MSREAFAIILFFGAFFVPCIAGGIGIAVYYWAKFIVGIVRGLTHAEK